MKNCYIFLGKDYSHPSTARAHKQNCFSWSSLWEPFGVPGGNVCKKNVGAWAFLQLQPGGFIPTLIHTQLPAVGQSDYFNIPTSYSSSSLWCREGDDGSVYLNVSVPSELSIAFSLWTLFFDELKKTCCFSLWGWKQQLPSSLHVGAEGRLILLPVSGDVHSETKRYEEAQTSFWKASSGFPGLCVSHVGNGVFISQTRGMKW